MNVGETICRLRKEKNMSQDDLAHALDVSRQSVSKWETNASVPELHKLVRMSDVFGVSIDALVRGARTEESKGAPQNAERAAPQAGLPARKLIALILLGFGLILVLLLSFLIGPVAALVLSSPLWVCAVLCFAVERHTGLWCGWVLYVLIYAYLRYATGIRFWWVVLKGLYRNGMQSHLLIAWAMTVALAALMIVTARLIYRKRKERSKGSTGA